jgi:murein DD-endopeptidase MepM/ murein hydrolase activator NlpD
MTDKNIAVPLRCCDLMTIAIGSSSHDLAEVSPHMKLRHTLLAGLSAATLVAGATACEPEDPAQGPTRAMCFPVEGTVSYTDTFGASRGGGTRTHEGQDLMGKKMQRLVATVDGTITVLKTGHATAGNYLYVKDAEGWIHAYVHINNDTPGTDDGKNDPAYIFAPGLKVGAKVKKGEFIAYLGDSGNAEDAGAHLHYELRKPDGSYSGVAVNAYNSLKAAATCTVLPAGTGAKS